MNGEDGYTKMLVIILLVIAKGLETSEMPTDRAWVRKIVVYPCKGALCSHYKKWPGTLWADMEQYTEKSGYRTIYPMLFPFV